MYFDGSNKNKENGYVKKENFRRLDNSVVGYGQVNVIYILSSEKKD